MDVVLGVAVTGPVARLALIGAGDTGVIDQSVVDLANNPIEQLTETVVGTSRLLAGEHHRLVGTRVCWTDHPQADQLRQALEDSGVHNVAVLSESQAVKALMRAAGRPGSALLFDDATATLSLVDSAETDDDAPPTLLAHGSVTGDATAALDTMMARLGEQPNAPQDVLLVGASGDLDRVAEQLHETSTMRVQIPEDPTFALARGAALAAAPLAPDATAMAPAAVLTGDETAMAPAAGLDPDATTIVPADAQSAEAQLAYSLAEDGAELPPGDLDGFDEYYDSEAETGPLKLSRRSLLLGNAVIAFAVIGVASLAVAVVVAVRPTASQEPVLGHQNAAPGKFMPLLPTQQQAPVPPPLPEAPNAGYQGGTIPAPAAPPALGPAPGGSAPIVPGTPGVPGAPGFVPNPIPGMPIPIPIIVPFPGWRPQPPPYWPPYNPYPPYPPPTTPTTTSTTPTTTTTPTTSETPTTTTTPTTSETPTTSSTPTTSETPTTSSTPTTSETPTTSSTPTSTTPTTTTPRTSSSTPTTTVAPTTTPSYTPLTPSTTVAPTTVPSTTVAPTTVPTTVAPTTKAPTQPTVAPTQPTVAPTHTQAPVVPKPVTPQQPHSNSGF